MNCSSFLLFFFLEGVTETATIAKDADGIYTLTIESNGAVYTKANE